MQDVPGYVKRTGLQFACYMDPDRTAVIDGAFAARLNYETYFFADSAARETFRADPVQFCGMLTDPVTKQRFRPSDASPSYTHEKVLYLFESLDTYEAFVSMPNKHMLPGYKMTADGVAPKK